MTKTSGKTKEDGSFNFRGFFGNYKIVLKTKDGSVRTFKIHLSKSEQNRWEFKL
jgi:hypothetical protein